MISKIRKKLKKFIPGLIVIALLAGGFLYLTTKNGVTKVTATKAEVRTISKTISASGETGVSDGSTVRALIGGNIEDLKFKTGDQIKKNDIVLEMDRASLKASLDTSYAAYLSAKLDIDTYDQKVVAAKATESVRKRERDEAWRNYMADSGETEKQAYKNADALYQAALSSLNVLEDGKKATQNAAYSGYSTYYSALNNYNNSTIKAPADGQLALSDIYTGSYVTSGQELFSIVSLQNIIFKAEIDEADISHMKVGMKAKVSLDSYPGEYFEGEVTNIDAKVRVLPSGSTVVSGDISFKDNKILPILKLSGSADIEIDKSEALVSVTPDSIFDESDKKYVYVVVADTVVKKAVEVGFEGDDYVGLISGVNEGDLVVTEIAGVNLKAGQKVKL
jgi:RND family efflux transporter MFP subunit